MRVCIDRYYSLSLYVCMYVCMYVRVSGACMYVCLHICAYMCICTRVYVCDTSRWVAEQSVESKL